VAKPESDRVPLAEFTKKVPPLCPSSGNPEHSAVQSSPNGDH
jgi:hypothetical protein